jgi:glycosyltransferase involved in cell wall biosynthesis
VLYVQYCNPAAYPPIEHGAGLLADAGFDVTLLGTDVPGDAIQFRPRRRIRVEIISARGNGLHQKLLYLRYAAWVMVWSVRLRPSWIYASDPLSCPVALAVGFLTGARTIYHEHDSPEPDGRAKVSIIMRFALWARRRVAHTADLCVLPNVQRAELFRTATRRNNVLSVWNCPTRAEALTARGRPEDGELRVVYHGSIVPARLPLTTIRALATLPNKITLTVVGYETLGQFGYSRELKAEAARLGVADRVTFLTAVPRSELMEHCGQFDVGLALFSQLESEINQRTMVGASNKAFDYMAGGLALLVTDLPDWRATYVDQGFGLCCHPDSADSIAAALKWFWDNRAAREAMALRGRQRILAEWNYERTFAPVLEYMTEDKGGRVNIPAIGDGDTGRVSAS